MMEIVERFQSGQTSEDLNGYTHTREFRVRLERPSVTAHHEALNADGIPRIGEGWPIFDRTQVIKRTARPMSSNDRLNYLVTVDYGIPSAQSIAKKEKKPWERRSFVSFDFVEAPEPLEKDYSDTPKPILNSAGDFFENQLMEDKVKLKIIITRARINYNVFTAMKLMNTICPTALELPSGGGTINEKMTKLLIWAGSENEYSGDDGDKIRYFDERIEILCDDKQFIASILDSGFYERVEGSEKPVRILDENGKPKATASLLNGSGRRSDTPTYLTFKKSKIAPSWDAIFPL